MSSAPEYDDVYWDGVAWLDELASEGDEMTLRLSLGDADTFGEAGFVIAEKWGLEHEYLEYYAKFRDEGNEDPEAAFYALGEWDLLEFVDD